MKQDVWKIIADWQKLMAFEKMQALTSANAISLPNSTENVKELQYFIIPDFGNHLIELGQLNGDLTIIMKFNIYSSINGTLLNRYSKVYRNCTSRLRLPDIFDMPYSNLIQKIVLWPLRKCVIISRRSSSRLSKRITG